MKFAKFLSAAIAVCAMLGVCACDAAPSGTSSTAANTSSVIDVPSTGSIGDTLANDKWSIKLLSAKTFDSVEDGVLTDTPSEGMQFLTLFFEVENIGDQDDYFNYFYFDSYTDGYSTQLRIMFTKPDGYETLTGDIAAGKKLQGSLTWEVSPDWKEFETSFKEIGADNKLTFAVTPADLTE